MFDERAFITQKQRNWDDLGTVLERVKVYGLRKTAPEDLARLGSLYRRAAADLAYARTQHATSELVFYLNELVGLGHGILYRETSGRSLWTFIRNFFVWELPDTLRRRTPFIFATFLITLLSGILAGVLVHENSGNLSLFLGPAFADSFNGWKQGFADHGTITAGEGALFSASLMTHNTMVGIVSFALGITTVIPLYMLYDNGCLMGALVAVVLPTGHSVSMWAGLLPHGVCELSALFICAGAGLLIGWSLIHPGRLTRGDALLANSKDAVKMVIGTIPLFIIAGIIEGNVSHAEIPHTAKFLLAGVQFIALLTYIYGRWTRVRPELDT